MFSWTITCIPKLQTLDGPCCFQNKDIYSCHNCTDCWNKAWNLNEEGRLRGLVDFTLSIQNDEEVEVHRVMTTALVCLQTAAERRPTMAQAVGMLQGDIVTTEPVRGRLNENVNHRAFLGLNSSASTLMPVDEESQVLHLGESSSSGSGPKSLIELNAVRAR